MINKALQTLSAVVVLLAAASSQAAIMIDDGFSGSSPGAPPGWTNLGSTSSVDDSDPDSVQLLVGGGIESITSFDASGGFGVSATISAMSGIAPGAAIRVTSGSSNKFYLSVSRSGNITLEQSDSSHSYLQSTNFTDTFSGSAIAVWDLLADASGFQITSSNGYDSGLQTWTYQPAFANFQVSTLTLSEPGIGTVNFDHVTLSTNTEQSFAIPTPSSVVMLVGPLAFIARYRRRGGGKSVARVSRGVHRGGWAQETSAAQRS